MRRLPSPSYYKSRIDPRVRRTQLSIPREMFIARENAERYSGGGGGNIVESDTYTYTYIFRVWQYLIVSVARPFVLPK